MALSMCLKSWSRSDQEVVTLPPDTDGRDRRSDNGVGGISHLDQRSDEGVAERTSVCWSYRIGAPPSSADVENISVRSSFGSLVRRNVAAV